MQGYVDLTGYFYFLDKIKKEGRKAKTFKRLFGTDEYGFICLPEKISSAKIAKYKNVDKLHCGYCSPNKGCNRIAKRNRERSWKKHRKHQWK